MQLFDVFKPDFTKLGKGADVYWRVDMRVVGTVKALNEEQAIEVAKKKGHVAPIIGERIS